MALQREEKLELINQHKKHDKDTGSSEVQIALLTRRIQELTVHFKTHAKDHNSRRGLLMLVSKRRKLLDYLKAKNYNAYRDIIQELKIRK